MSKVRRNVHLQNTAKGCAFVAALFVHCFAIANENAIAAPATQPAVEQGQVKSFNEVLQDLVNEFSFDLRAKALNTLRTVSIRRVALGEGIPRTYESYLETQIADSFRKHSGTKVLQCMNCRVRRTVVENGRLVMTTPINNPQELDSIASQLGVDAWVDVTLLYQETSMVLGFHVFDSKSKEMLWTKLYNTENIYKQKAEAKETEERQKFADDSAKKSKYSFSTTLGWQLVPNVKTSANMIGLNFKFAERFNLGRDEVGTRLSAIVAPSVIISDYPEISGDPAASAEIVDGTSKEVILPFSKALGLFALYGHLFNDEAAVGDGAVWGAEFGAGTIVSKGYACFSLRSGGTLRLGQRFTLDAAIAYSLPTTISIRNKYKYTTPGGVGADFAFGLHF
ncbi:MAG: hypothetical protein ACO3A4_03225 [Silvanigrellaceae bacterium]